MSGKFGAAGDEVVIEELLAGEEVSCLAITDGYTVYPLPGAQDHKRAYDGDKGPNTGGMGAYSPAAIVSPAIFDEVMDTVIKTTVDAMQSEGMPYTGFLYAGCLFSACIAFVAADTKV